MQKLRLGIIGVGHLGQIHVKLASEIQSINLVGIFDIDQARSQSVADKYQTKSYVDLDRLLNDVDAVCIVVPTESHYQIGLKALDQGCHIFMEKPFTAKLDQARHLIKRAEKDNKTIQVGHIERFNPAYQALESYSLDPLFIESHRLSQFNPRGTDVSVILDLMIHDIDIVLNLISSPVQNIQACGVAVVSESEDIANVRLSFENGSVANVTSSRISASNMRKMRIFQKNAYITLDFLNQKSEILLLKDQLESLEENQDTITFLGSIGTKDKGKHFFLKRPKSPEINPLRLELESFSRCLLENIPPCLSGQEALKTMEVIEEIINQIQHPTI